MHSHTHTHTCGLSRKHFERDSKLVFSAFLPYPLPTRTTASCTTALYHPNSQQYTSKRDAHKNLRWQIRRPSAAQKRRSLRIRTSDINCTYANLCGTKARYRVLIVVIVACLFARFISSVNQQLFPFDCVLCVCVQCTSVQLQLSTQCDKF